MLKEEFNNLSVAKQVEYINNKLPSQTLTSICKELNIARSTISSKLKKSGYKLDLKQNKYILEFQEDKSKVEFNSNKTEYNSNEIEELLEMKDKIKILLNWFENEQVATKQNDFNIQLDKFEGEAVSRTFVLYPNVLDRYLKFCEAHREYRRQDILSKAITEFLDRYK